MLFSAQNYADALPKFSKAIDLGITNVAAYVYKVYYYYLQDYENAVVWLDKSITLNSSVNSAYLWRANSLYAGGKFQESLYAYNLYLSKVRMMNMQNHRLKIKEPASSEINKTILDKILDFIDSNKERYIGELKKFLSFRVSVPTLKIKKM